MEPNTRYTSPDGRRTAVVRYEVTPGRWAVDVNDEGGTVMLTVDAKYLDGWREVE